MRYTTILLLLVLTLGISVAGATCSDAGSDGLLDGIITVNKSGNCPVIQWAINNATGGDKIVVHDGVYTENIEITKPLTIVSQNGPLNCSIGASDSNESVISITADNVVIDGFSVNGGT